MVAIQQPPQQPSHMQTASVDQVVQQDIALMQGNNFAVKNEGNQFLPNLELHPLA